MMKNNSCIKLAVFLTFLFGQLSPNLRASGSTTAEIVGLTVGSFAMGGIVFGVGEIARSSAQRSNFWPVYVNTTVGIIGFLALGSVISRNMWDEETRPKYTKIIVQIAFGLGCLVGGYTYYINLHPKDAPNNDIYMRFATYRF